MPRSGKIAEIDFPFIQVTEIDGTAVIGKGADKTAAGDLDLELVDAEDPEQVISKTKTAYDGYYIFSDVPPGQYILRVEPEQATKLRLVTTALKKVRVLPNSNYINGMDISVKSAQGKAGENAKLNLGKMIDPKSDNATGSMPFVILGAFAIDDSFLSITEELGELGVPIVRHNFLRLLPVYRVKATYKDEASAKSSAQILTKYGYPFREESNSEGFSILIGPYYSEQIAKSEKSILSAALLDQKLQLVSENIPANMAEIAVGGFVKRQDAHAAAKLLKEKYGFNEALVQNRPMSFWRKLE